MSAKLLIFVTRLSPGGKEGFPDPLPLLCKPLAIYRKTHKTPLLIVLDAPSLLRVELARLPTVSPRAIVCRVREL
jgi:hypothetical protein